MGQGKGLGLGDENERARRTDLPVAILLKGIAFAAILPTQIEHQPGEETEKQTERDERDVDVLKTDAHDIIPS